MEISEQSFNQDGNSLKIYDNIIYTPVLTKGEPGEQGLKGEKGERGDILTYDKLTPSLRINIKGEPGNKGEQGSPGRKGDKGDRGEMGYGLVPHITATATLDNVIDLPHVDVVVSGTDENPVLNFRFRGLRGYDGINGQKGEKGATATLYDDSSLRARVEELISAEERRIKNLISELDGEIKESVTNMVKEAEFWRENLPEGVIGGNSNFGLDDVKEYLQLLGLWETSDGVTYTKWSTIKLEVNNIRLEVNELRENPPSGGETEPNYESLSAALYSYINANLAVSGLQSTWTKFLKLSNDDIQVLKWVSAGVKAVASSEEAVTDLFAIINDNEAGTEAYAGLNARVTEIEGKYVSTTSLSSYVNNAVTSSMAGLVTQASLDEAIATLNARIDNGSGGSSSAGLVTQATFDQAIAEIYARIDNGSGGSSSAGLVTLATFDSAIAELNARIDSVDGTNMAGVITEANLDGAVAALFARSSNTKDAVGEYIGNGGSGSGDEVYAGLQLRVQNIENDYVTSSDLSSRVNDSVSGLFTENSSNSAVALLYARVSNNEDEIASIKASAGPGGTQIDLTADQINSVAKTTTITTSGLHIQDYSNTGTSVDTRLYVDGGFNVNGGGQVTCNTINCSGSIASTVASVNSYLATPKLQDSTGTVYVTLTSGYGNTPSQIVTNSGLFKVDGYASIQNDLNVTGDLSSNNATVNGTVSTSRIQDPSGTSSIALTGNSGGAISMNAAVVVANGNVISSSDESLKNVILNIDNVYVEQIANVRTVNYEFKNRPGIIKTGTIALDWQHILPNTVTPIDNEYHLGLDYSSAALISAVVDAREIVKLKQENEELKQRLAAIEAKLS